MDAPAAKPFAAWFMLVSRSLLFVAFQALTALILAAAGEPAAWDESARWWVLVAALTNVASILLLVRVFRAEGKRYRDLLRFSRPTVKRDLLWFFGLNLVGLPIVALPMNTLAAVIFGDPTIPTNLMFRPLPMWAIIAGFLFPLTIAFAELPTYFGYVMPRLAVQLEKGWLAWLLSALFLAFQHAFLPLILDGRFMLWRAGMFLPFALYAGLVLKLRPTLLPYFLIVHALMDVSTMLMYLMV